MKKKQVENYEEIEQKVKEVLHEQESSPTNLKIIELEDNEFPPSATCVIDFDLLHIFKVCKPRKKEDKIMSFEAWWGCVYPEKQLFVLEFWQAEPDTLGTIFKMYLTPQNVKSLIRILRKGLKCLENTAKTNKN
jgi:hypothetical protein